MPTVEVPWDGERADIATGDPRRFRQFVLLDLLFAASGVVLLTTLVLLPDDTYDYLWPFAVATALCVALLAWPSTGEL